MRVHGRALPAPGRSVGARVYSRLRVTAPDDDHEDAGSAQAPSIVAWGWTTTVSATCLR